MFFCVFSHTVISLLFNTQCCSITKCILTFKSYKKFAVLWCAFQRKSHLAQPGVPEQFCAHGFLACWPHRRKRQNAELWHQRSSGFLFLEPGYPQLLLAGHLKESWRHSVDKDRQKTRERVIKIISKRIKEISRGNKKKHWREDRITWLSSHKIISCSRGTKNKFNRTTEACDEPQNSTAPVKCD